MIRELLNKSALAFLAMGLLSMAGAMHAQENTAEADRIVGTWLTANAKAHIEVYKCGEKYCGRISWMKEPDENGKPKVDKKNPDEKLRNQSLLGLRLMREFKYDGDNEWVGGKVYDAESGEDYSGKLTLKDDNTMDLRGYVLIPLFGRSETWTRVVTESKGK
jgi:uncharacterized protein (DUF2147 family)